MNFPSRLSVAIALSAVVSQTAFADTTESTWSGGTSAAWTTSTNWSPNTIPSSTVSAEFNSTFATQPSLGSSAGAAQGIWVTGATPTTGVNGLTTIGGTGTLTLAGNATLDSLTGMAILLDGAGNNSLTINAPVTTSAASRFIINNAGTLTLSNTLSLGAVFTFGATGDNAGGTINLNGIASTAFGVTFATNGTVNLNGTTAATGNSTLTTGIVNLTGSWDPSRFFMNGGTLNITGAGNIIATGQGLQVGGGAVLNDTATDGIQGATALKVANGTAILMNANTFSGTVSLGGTNTLDNTSVLLGNASALGTGTIAWNGGTVAVSTPLNITTEQNINGAGGMSLGGTNAITFSGTVLEASGGRPIIVNDAGGVTISGGTFTDSGTLPIWGGGNLTIGDVITGTGGLNYSGTGTVTLTGQNTYSAGTSFANGGTLLLDFSAAGAPTGSNGIISSSSALTGNGGNLVIKGAGSSASNTQTFNGLAVTAGGSTITLNQNGNTTLTLALGAMTHTAGATLNFSNVPSASGIVVTTGTSTSYTPDTNGIVPWLTVGSGTSLAYGELSGSNIIAFTGGTAATGSTVNNAATDYAYSGGGTLTLAAGSTGNTLQSTGTTTTLSNTGTTSLNGLMNSGTGLVTVSSGTLTAGANKELDIFSNSQGISISSVIANSSAGASSLVYGGTGTLTLSGPSTYTNGTFLDGGTLALNNATAVGTGKLTINSGTLVATNSANVTLSGNNTQSWTGNFGFGGAGGHTLNLGTGAVALAPVGGTAVTVTMAGLATDTLTEGGVISGSAGLTVAGSNSTLVLSGNNTYFGYTTVNGATLSVASDLNLAGSTGTVSVTSASTATQTVTFTGAAPANFGVGVTFLGSTVTATSFSGGVTTVTLSADANTTISTATTEAYAYANALTLNGGTLKTTSSFSLAETLATGAGATVNRALWLGPSGGTIDVASGTTLTVPGVITNYQGAQAGGSLTKVDTGTLTLSNANTFSGTTTVSGGSLVLKNSLALQDSTLTTGNVVFDSSVTANTFTLGGLSGGGTIALQNNAGTPAAVALGVGNNNATTTFSGGLSGAGSVEKVGTGATTFNSGNTYTGGTTVAEGRLLTANALGSATGTGGVTVVGSTAILGGTGKISGAVTLANGGNLYSGATASSSTAGPGPGAVTGTSGGMTLSNTLNVNGAALTFALSDGGASTFASPAMTTSYLTTTSSVTFTGNDTINLVDLSNGTLSLRQSSPYLLIKSSLGDSGFLGLVIENTSGQISLGGDGYVLGVNSGTTGVDSGGGYTWNPLTFDQFGSDGVTPLTGDAAYPGGLQLYLDAGQLEVVPEPGTWAMMLGGLALLIVIQRRRARL